MSVYSKLLEAQKAIKHVPKNGKNTFHKYDYAMEADILDAVKTAANEVGLIIVTSATSEIGTYDIIKGFDQNGSQLPPEVVRWAKVTIAYRVIDSETGEAIEGTFDGYAEDKGDKAIYKATTGANKYMLMKLFGVSTGDDPEKDEAPKPQKPSQVAAEPQATADSFDDYVKGKALEYGLSYNAICEAIGYTGERLTIARRSTLTKAVADYCSEHGRKTA